MIHTVKGFSIFNETEGFFWKSLASSMIQQMLAIWSLIPLPFLIQAWTSGSSQFPWCWSLGWRILSITLLVWVMSAIVQWFKCSLVLPFLGIWIRIDLFQSCGHYWVFHICWHIECSTLTPSSLRILNSPSGITSLPLALLATVLPKAHLTSYSRMSDSKWVTTPLWLSGSLTSFYVGFFFVLLYLLDLFCFC